jgi:phosphoribosylamine--glycine ligase
VNVLVVGSGAREDALSWRLAQSKACSAIFACPGNAGTASRAENWSDLQAIDGKAIARRAREHGIDLAVIGPETAIAAGVTDHVREAGIATFGPSRSAGRLESSKVFAKRFMERYGVPTASARVARSLENAKKILSSWSGGCVVKADGLAAGKGVVVLDTPREALELLGEWFGPKGVPGGGSDVLLEQRLAGREVSVFALGDGNSFEILGAACDYKRAGDGDTGPNTGGMGAYSPPVGFPPGMEEAVRERIIAPMLRGLEAEREPYIGVLYCGLIWTQTGPCVIEFNVRFGDPETQVLMPRVQGDFAELLHACATGKLAGRTPSLSDDACVGVVIATSDYPRTSVPLARLPADISLGAGRQAFWGTSQLRDGFVDSAGGRVLTVTALGANVAIARSNAYDAAAELAQRFGAQLPLKYRSDVAANVLPATADRPSAR